MTGGEPTALVTGAGRGIGRACAQAFRDQGWRAVAGVRDVAAAAEAYAGTGVLVVRLDVADPASVAEGVAAAERHAGGALACLVSNAAYGVLGAVEEGRPFGIRVSTVEPGMVDTEFPKAVRPTGAAARGEGPYAPLREDLRRGFAAWRRDHPMGPEVVARAVVAAALDPDPPFRIPVGDDTLMIAAMREAGDDRAFHDGLVDVLGLDWPRRTSG